MSTTTKKHDEFVGEPMGNKSVTTVPGVGETIGGHMKSNGIIIAKQLYGLYLQHNEKDFKEKVRSYGANNEHVNDVFCAMRDYDQQHN